MKSPEVIGMAVFGLLVVGALVLAIYQGAQQRKQIASYAARHGWNVSRPGDARLSALLEQVSPEEDWGPNGVMQVERPPESVYLFGYNVTSKRGRSSPSTGNACLAEHTGRVHQGPVVIFTRVPGIDKLVGNRVKAGGEEFRDKFTVTCVRPEEALNSVNAEVERILLDHIAGPGWTISVTIAGRGVLVSSHWAETDQDWDYLIALARRLRAAVR